MRKLNYHHLYYFWAFAQEGSVTAACERLGVAQPTVSAQLRSLERSIGQPLLQPVGRNLELTEAGRVVYRYANDIFALGDELVSTLDGRPTGSRQRLRVGVADVLPKLVVSRLLEPLVKSADPVHMMCFEGKPSELLAKLSVHELDVVLSDSPITPEIRVRAFNHMLGECDVSFFAPNADAARYRKEFPQSIDGAPWVGPTDNTSLRRELEYWFNTIGVKPQIIAEFEDSALLKTFAPRAGTLFAAPSVIAAQIESTYPVSRIGRAESIRERFYAISLERKVKYPAVVALLESAHDWLSYE
jgi:LysR family transcriptional activator of nhaA